MRGIAEDSAVNNADGAEMATATLIKDNLRNFNGRAALYRCEPAMPLREPWDDEEERKPPTEYVIVSAANVMFSGPETYIFPADDYGNVTDWGELEGSYRGGLSHAVALSGAGYELFKEAV